MEYRQIGHSDLKLSAITFGAWAAGGWMWGKTEHRDAVEAILKSFDQGISSIDTAPIYGQGASELIVGEACKAIGRQHMQIVTKFGMRWDLAQGELAMHSMDNAGKAIDIYKYAGAESVIYECEQSLRRLKTDYIDLYQIHWHDKTTAIAETFEAVYQLQRSGKIRYAGVCNYEAQWVEEAAKQVDIISNQLPFSMINQGIKSETLPYCMAQGLSVLAYSPMERGLLTGKIKPGHDFAPGDHRQNYKVFAHDHVKKVNKLLEKIKPIAQEKHASLSQLVLAWTIAQPGITIALAGARNASQAIQNAAAVQIKLNTQEIDYINTLLAEAGY